MIHISVTPILPLVSWEKCFLFYSCAFYLASLAQAVVSLLWATAAWTQVRSFSRKTSKRTGTAGERAKIFVESKMAVTSGLFHAVRMPVSLAPALCSPLPTSILAMWLAAALTLIWRLPRFQISFLTDISRCAWNNHRVAVGIWWRRIVIFKDRRFGQRR